MPTAIAWSFYTSADALIFSLAKPPVYQAQAGTLVNVVAAETIGGQDYSETRGSDRWVIPVLSWPRIPGTELASFTSLHASYGGRKAPFKFAPATGLLPGVSTGTTIAVVWLDEQLAWTWVAYDRYAVAMRLRQYL